MEDNVRENQFPHMAGQAEAKGDIIPDTPCEKICHKLKDIILRQEVLLTEVAAYVDAQDKDAYKKKKMCFGNKFTQFDLDDDPYYECKFCGHHMWGVADEDTRCPEMVEKGGKP